MAAVAGACPSRKTKSQVFLHKTAIGQARDHMGAEFKRSNVTLRSVIDLGVGLWPENNSLEEIRHGTNDMEWNRPLKRCKVLG